MSQKIIVFGEILLRLSPPNHLKVFKSKTFEAHYGGAEANVGASLALMGCDVNVVTALPQNELGASAESEMLSYNMKTNIIRQGERIGIYYFEQGASERPGRVIYDRNNSSFSLLKKGMIDWKSIFKEAKWFHWSGITPALSQDLADVCEEALIIASEMGLTISADLNYRPTLWNYGKKANEIMPNLIQYCDVLLGGIDDSENCLAIQTNEEDSFETVYKNWQDKHPKLKTIVSTLRYDANASSNTIGAVLWNNSKLYRAKEYKISHIIDRIGAGDAFMAGLIYGLIKLPEEPQKTVEYALAASCLKHSIAGDINLASAEDITALMNGSTGGRVIR
ncbi:sugar kinase [Flavobacterium sp. GA093]|uniref:Sugar kinase n=1 Tax=Flavobacterium hydrocarbonoxydans TaxID=2683249 RepID=A0A6I4NHW3_9FLAO|nr:sugar kinase [Flavobacterium hydrocarbonoxydans]MWB94066.1 sugar kinase [Flavobacterium hydrocarbonoxydans]